MGCMRVHESNVTFWVHPTPSPPRGPIQTELSRLFLALVRSAQTYVDPTQFCFTLPQQVPPPPKPECTRVHPVPQAASAPLSTFSTCDTHGNPVPSVAIRNRAPKH